MTAHEFIAELHSLGVRLRLEDGRLHVSAPEGVLTPNLREELTRRKPDLIRALGVSGAGPICARDSGGSVPLSFAQERLWVFDRLETGSTTYNTEVLLRLEGQLDQTALCRGLEEVVRRHEALRTTFHEGDDGPVQRVSSAASVDLRVIDLTDRPASQRDEEARRLIATERNIPFRLDQDLLLRAMLLRQSDVSYLLLLVSHHIVADGSSLIVLVRDLAESYRGFVEGDVPALQELPIRYSDYARWERDRLKGPAIVDLLAYWRERLGGELPTLDLPVDRVRMPMQTFRGGNLVISIDAEMLQRLRRLARQAAASLYALLLAAFKVVLYRDSGQDDLIVGAAIQGRERPETQNLVGMFVNTIPIRSDLSGDPTFRELVGRVRKSVLGALAHGDLPFEKIVEIINPPRDHSRSPVFQVLFNGLNMEAPEEILLPGLRVSLPNAADLLGQLDVESKFDLTVYSRESVEGLELSLVYNADLFDHERMEALLGHYRQLLLQAVADPDRRIGDIDLLTERERATLPVPIDRGRASEEVRDVVSRFSEAASRWADRPAVNSFRSRCTYRGLDELSNRVASGLLDAMQTSSSRRVGILCEAETQLFAALLGVLKAGRSFVPLDPVNPAERLEHMVANAGIELILADQANAMLAQRFKGCSVRFLEDMDAPADAQLPAPPSSDSEAYVLYTSGSTGTPKGVIQSYANLSRHAEVYARSLRIHESDRVSLVSSYGFDAALVDIFGALLKGAMLVPMHVHQQGIHRLRDKLLEHEITVYHSTPTVFRALLGFSEGDVFDSVRAVVLGGEPVHRSDADTFREHFPRGAFLVNLFGASESTTALEYRVDHDTKLDRGSVPVGYPVGGTEVLLLDEQGRPTPVMGEIGIQSRQVALGYNGEPALTKQSFLEVSGEPELRLYRTGDLARRRPDGALVCLGRKDHQVKLRGYRVELGEIESVLEQHEAVSQAVAWLDEQEGRDMLVAYATGPAPEALDARALRLHMLERVPSFMVPDRVVVMPELPVTVTGKVDRTRLPTVSLDGRDSYTITPPRNAIEESIAAIWEEVLAKSNLGVNQDFFDLGGNSLQATQIVSRIKRVLGHELPLRDFFGGATIAGNAERLTTSVVDPSASPHPKPLQRDESIPLSFSQERMWFIQQLNPGTSAYNISGAVWLDGTFDKSAMERAWTCIVARHESLRTNIVPTDGIPYQVIAESDSFRVEWADVSELPEAERRTEARQLAISRASRPFDLERECPLRVLLVRVAENRQLMAVVIHHAMGDLWSLGVMGRELVVHYNAFRAGRTPELPSLPIQYRDFAIWQRNWFTGQRLEGEKAYWRKQLDGIQPLSLPTDRPRNAALSLRGGRVMSELPAGLAEASSSLAVRVGITPFMLLLGVFNVLLSRYAQMTDISVGVPIANRTHVDIESLVGTFVNTLVLRNDLSGDPTFTELLERVREVALGAYAHQDLPFEKLVTELSPERDMSSAPLVQVLFNVVNIPMQVPELDGLMLIPEPLSNQGAQFDLTLSVSIREPRGVSLSYNQELFDPATAEQIMTHYVALLEDAIRRPDARLSDLEMMSAAERSKLLESWNQTAMEYPRNVIFAELFEAQVARDPERTAVESGNESLTYGELDSRAEAVAGALRARAVGVGARVAVLMDRGPDMIVSLLGIMKSGAAYVPLDPAFPARRLGFVLEDSGAAVMLTQVEYAAMLTGSTAEILCVGALAEQVCETEVDTGTTAAAAGPEDPAYVIYTSGSTGKPKGVVVPNRALVNFLYAMVEQPGLSESDVLAAVTTVSFDIAALELYLPLLVGARVALLRKEEVEDPFQLAESLERAGATAMQATPATWRMLIDSGWQGIPDLKALCGGEALPPDLVASLLLRVRELWNMYGPTETTIWSSIHKVESVEDLISIGRPIANTQIHILDEQLQPVPVGARGELHIGGDGLARGYLNRPELTKEKFIPNPLTFALSPRLYKTGDVARYLPDGRIECLGRMDHQVKIRGFRIELGEIETALSSHPAVNKCVVVAREDSPGAKRLAAYYLPSDGQSLTVSDMRSHLKQTLPDYMIPTVVVCLDKLPLTPNGKIDRRALPILKQSWADSERQFAAPRTPVEETLAEIWREVLGLEKVGIHDDFFDLGGHSLLATQVVSRLRRSAFPVELPLRQLFDSPTIAALGEFVAQSLVDQQQGEELSQIISEIQDLTPEELEARLNEIGMNV